MHFTFWSVVIYILFHNYLTQQYNCIYKYETVYAMLRLCNFLHVELIELTIQSTYIHEYKYMLLFPDSDCVVDYACR